MSSFLEKTKNFINYGEVLGDGSTADMTYHTWTEEEVDYAATQSAISSCKADAQAVIDKITLKIEEIDEHIQKINDMVEEIAEKRTLMESLGNNFTSAQGFIDNANININFEVGCEECLTGMNEQLDAMEVECTTKLEEYNLKKEEANNELTAAKTALDECSNIVKTHTVTRHGWW